MLTGKRPTVFVVALLAAALLAAACSESSPTGPIVQSGSSGGSHGKPGGSGSAADTSAPIITVQSPTRSAMLAQGTLADDNIAIRGQACDSADGMSSVTVVGTSVPVSGHPTCASFDVEQASRWGLSIVTADASSKGGAADTLVQAYLRSPTYLPAASSPGSETTLSFPDAVPTASELQLNQPVLDDGDRTTVNDLATVLQLALNGSNLSSRVKVHVDYHWWICSVTVENAGPFTSSPIQVRYLHADTSGLSAQITTTNLQLPLSMPWSCNLRFHTLSGTVTGTLLADKATLTTKQQITSDSTGGLRTTPKSDSLAFTNLRLVRTSPVRLLSRIIQGLTRLILKTFHSTLSNMGGTAINSVLRREISSLIRPRTISFPPPIGTAIGLRWGFDQTGGFVTGGSPGSGFVRIGLAGYFFPKSAVGERNQLSEGAIRKDGAPPTFTTGPYDLGVGVKDDALNDFLWAAWAGGAFDFQPPSSDSCLAGLPGTATSVRAGLPPVLMPGRSGSAMDVGLGDLLVKYATADDPTAASFYVSAIGGLTIGIDSTYHRLTASVDPNPEMHVQLASADSGVDVAGLGPDIEQAARCLYRTRIAAVVGSYPIPSLDLGSLGIPGVPAGTVVGLSDATLTRAGSYWVLTGTAQQQ